MPITTSFGRGGGVAGGGVVPQAFGGPVQPTPTPPMSFGEYMNQFPTWLSILAMLSNPSGFLSGYMRARQGEPAQELERQRLQLYGKQVGLQEKQFQQTEREREQKKQLQDWFFQNYKDVNWGEMGLKRKVQREAIKAGFSPGLVSDFVDTLGLSKEQIVYYDPDEQKLVLHKRTKKGVQKAEKYIPVNLQLAEKNPYYVYFLTKTYPGLKKYITDQSEVTPAKKEAAKKAFLREWAKKGTDGMIKKYGNKDVFVAAAADVLGRKPSIDDPEKMLRQWLALHDNLTKREDLYGLNPDEKTLKNLALKEISLLQKRVEARRIPEETTSKKGRGWVKPGYYKNPVTGETVFLKNRKEYDAMMEKANTMAGYW